MKKIICWAALVLALCLPVCALAATEPNTRTIEDTTTYEGETIQITIDQWCYAFNRTSLRFFVANVYVDDPAQLQTAFAGEEYSKSNSEATSAIAERHDAIFAVNGDYYNYKDKNGLVIRNGVLYRDEASTRDQLLVMNDGAVAMQGTPPEIFTHAEELAAMGLDVPQVNRVILALRHMGLDLDAGIFTVDQAVQALTARKGGPHA